MAIKVNIHTTHREFADDKAIVDVEGKTIGDCVDALVKQYPAMQAALFQKKGKLLNQIEIYLNMESAYPDELKKTVKDGDEIHIVVMLAGG